MSREEIKASVLRFLSEELHFDPDGDAGEQDLFEDGAVDSLGFVNLLGFLQATYDLDIAPADIRPETFRTVNVIADYVVSRLGSTVSA